MRLCAAMCLFVFRCVRLSFTRLLQLPAYTAASLPVWLSLRLSVISMVMACTGPVGLSGQACIAQPSRGLTKWMQIVGANKFRTRSAEIADKIRRLVEVLQSGLQVRAALGRCVCVCAHHAAQLMQHV